MSDSLIICKAAASLFRRSGSAPAAIKDPWDSQDLPRAPNGLTAFFRLSFFLSFFFLKGCCCILVSEIKVSSRNLNYTFKDFVENDNLAYFGSSARLAGQGLGARA